jgi:hypothetical protein
VNPLHLILVEDDAGDARLITGALEHAGIAVDSMQVATEAALRDALADGEGEDIVATGNAARRRASTRARSSSSTGRSSSFRRLRRGGDHRRRGPAHDWS